MKDTSAIIGHGEHTGGASGSGLFSIDPGLMIWTWVVFGLLFIILRKFAWKPMMESVRQREKMVSDAVEQARKTKDELERIAEKQAEMLQQARDEARGIIEKGKTAAETAARTIHEKAAIDAKRELDSAREQIAREREHTLRAIKEQSVDIIIAASEKLISQSLDDETHRRIVKKSLEEM